ncbi:astacin, partial [Ostertagia ostertagi]
DGTSRKKRNCQTNPAYFWNPNYAIYYTIDNSLPSSYVTLIRQAIQFWTSNTCLRFQENPSGMNRLRFYYGTGCWSYIGKQASWTSQDISIGNGCNSLGTVAHEIAHALGFYHAQSRYDRDSYIRVNLNNVQSGLRREFREATENHFGLGYDFGSVMHYGGYAFAMNTNIYTIQTLQPEYQNTLGQRERPAFLGYLCTNVPVPPCRSPGIPNPRSCSQCLCPEMFAGSFCQNLPTGTAANCHFLPHGRISLNGVAGNPNSYAMLGITDCYWHISAPAGRRLQIRLSTPPKHCVQGCPWQGLEINLGTFDLHGMIVCCANTQTYTSTGNLVGLRGYVRYNQLTFGIDYRVV